MIVTTTQRRLALALALLLAAQATPVLADAAGVSAPLGFADAITRAQQHDPWLRGNRLQQKASNAMSIAAGSLPDPTVSIAVANLASDSLQFAQEPMTQLKIGVAQMFPRGDSLHIKQQQLHELTAQYPFQRQQRRASVAVNVGSLWLDAYLAQHSVTLIRENYSLFQQLVAVAEAHYVSAYGKNRQQDIVRAQLMLTRLDDRLTMLQQQQAVYQQQLLEWLYNDEPEMAQALPPMLNIAESLPDIALQQPALLQLAESSSDELLQHLAQHPAVRALQQKVIATGTGVALAKQQYRPKWGLNASYGLRQDSPLGQQRSDLLSIGVTFELPLFTERKQDQQVVAAVAQAEAVKTEKALLLRQLLAQFSSNREKLQRLGERANLYQQRLLPQAQLAAEAALAAYNSDQGDFADVMQARIDQLNAQIDALAIQVAQQKTRLALNYVTAQSTP